VPTKARLTVLPPRSQPDPKVFSAGAGVLPARRNQGQESIMNNDRIEGSWKSIKGKVKEQWGKLTDDDLDVIGGKRDQLLGRIQQRHGVAKDEAERQVDTFERGNPDYRFER
jgi:uncharacterized protein YjbJ (UPF0337 family)